MGLKKDIFWSEMESEFGEPAIHPTKNFQEYLQEICMIAVINSSASYNLFLSS